MIHVYNKHNEDFSFYKNHYNIDRPNILSNPYTHLKLEKTRAVYKCKDRDEAINNYALYFDAMYGHNVEFTKAIDEIYEKYKNGEEVYLGCWCHPQRCHGDIIKEKLQQMLIKEKIRERKKNG